MTAAHLAYNLLLCASRVVLRTPIFPAVDEAKNGHVLTWKSLAFVKHDPHVVTHYSECSRVLASPLARCKWAGEDSDRLRRRFRHDRWCVISWLGLRGGLKGGAGSVWSWDIDLGHDLGHEYGLCSHLT